MRSRADANAVRAKLNGHIQRSGRGAAAEIARAAGISSATLSKFQRNVYPGRCDQVAERLAEVLTSREVAELVASGQARTAWLLHRSKGLQLVKRADTMQAIVNADPDARVLTIFYGTQPGLVKIVEQGAEKACGGGCF